MNTHFANLNILYPALCFLGAFLLFAITRRRRALAKKRTIALLTGYHLEPEVKKEELEPAKIVKGDNNVFGELGFYTETSVKLVKLARVLGSIIIVGLAILIGVQKGVAGIFFGVVGGGYLAVVLWMTFVRYRKTLVERDVLFTLPVALESMILLVESGLGILPALEGVSRTKNAKNIDTTKIFLRQVYDLSANGMPFSDALEYVSALCPHRALRHVLLHLDIAGNQGGELIPSLRGLSSYAHSEWKLAVETRVKRLENLSVFPVFMAVIGLILLTAAVPLVPVFELRDSIKANQVTVIKNS